MNTHIPALSVRQQHKLKLSFTLKAPIFSHGTNVLRFGMDATPLMVADKQSKQQRQALPGSLIKGNIRHALAYYEELLSTTGETASSHELEAFTENWFGKEADSDNLPDSGALNFDYHWLSEESVTQTEQRNRIEIATDTGSVEEGSLQILETPFPSGKAVVFTGYIRLIATDSEKQQVCHWLDRACQYIDALGAFKGVGFGQLMAFQLTSCDMPPPKLPIHQDQQSDSKTEVRRMRLRVELDRPLCIAEPHQESSNLFRSLRYIPGNVLKGAIANRQRSYLGDQSAVNDWAAETGFSDWVVTHALPSTSAQYCRNKALPHSMFIADECYMDITWQLTAGTELSLSQQMEQQLLSVAAKHRSAIAFQSDWKPKHYAMAEQLINGDEIWLDSQIKVSTAIDSLYQDNGTGQSKPKALFAREELNTEGWRFICDIDLGLLATDQYQAAVVSLKQLTESPLIGIGKTKACATLQLEEMPFDRQQLLEQIKAQLNTGQLVITLQSHANLFITPPSNYETDHFSLYQDYFNSLNSEGLNLAYALASQSLRGGGYLLRRFRAFNPENQYQPLWLTEPGSVFGFELTDINKQEQIAEMVADWLQFGLPLANSQSRDKANSEWQTSPYINRNGFGEIILGTGFHPQQGVAE